MKGRFGTPLWVIPVLAMVMAIGAFAVFAGINQFSTPAEADLKEAGQGLSSNVDLEKLTEPFQNPIAAATAVTTGTATVVPEDPGAASRIELVFSLSGASGNLAPGTGRIIVRFPDDDWQVPNTLDRNQITLSADEVSNPSGGGVGIASDAVAPQSVDVDFVGTENDEPEITLTVPDMIAGTNDPAIGSQGIASGAEVTIVFQQSAGISNPTEGGDYDVRVRTSDAADNTFTTIDTITIPFLLELSSTGDPRGEVVTFLGKGFKNGTTVTFFRDANGDNDDAGERVLCRAVAGSDDTATCNYTMANPPFTPGFGTDCVGDFTGAGGTYVEGSLANCNYVNAFDGENSFASQRDQDDLDASIFELEPTITAAPSTANIGDTLVISLFDFTPGSTIPADGTLAGGGVTLGGVGVATPDMSAATVGANGQTNFSMDIPAGVPLGVQRLDVEDSLGAAQDITITVGGANLSISHTEVIANQDLTITGNGFSQPGGATVCILQGDVLLNSVEVEIDDDSVDTDCGNDANNPLDLDGVELSSGGTFTMTVILREDGGGVPSGLLTAGTHELKITDSRGAEGSIDVTIPARTLEVTPTSARPRDVITIIGRNFIADNTDGDNVDVELTYDCGVDEQSESADPDVSGNFRETIRIPTDCTIPSTNTITADINDSGGTTGVVDTIIHDIPDSLVRVEPVRGPQGSTVTITGEGFRTFDTVESIEFGGRGTLGGRTVNTDGRGNFTVDDLVIPGLDPGVHAVIVTVGSGADETTASTSFEVLEEGFAGALTSDAEEVFGGITTLQRAWLFDNTDKEWEFFDTRDEFTDINSLLEVPSGAPVWLLVTEDTEVELNAQPFNLTCVNPGTPEEDCWNLIVFP